MSRLSPLIAIFSAVTIAVLVPSPSAAHADPRSAGSLREHRVVATHTILAGPHWGFTETHGGKVIVSRADAGTIVVGRDLFTRNRRSALLLEAHLGGVLGLNGRSEHAGSSLGLKLRTHARFELGAAIALFYHFDPSELLDGNTRAGAIAHLSYDLDDAAPFTTRIVLRAQLQNPTPTFTTLDTFVGIGTRWP